MSVHILLLDSIRQAVEQLKMCVIVKPLVKGLRVHKHDFEVRSDLDFMGATQKLIKKMQDVAVNLEPIPFVKRRRLSGTAILQARAFFRVHWRAWDNIGLAVDPVEQRGASAKLHNGVDTGRVRPVQPVHSVFPSFADPRFWIARGSNRKVKREVVSAAIVIKQGEFVLVVDSQVALLSSRPVRYRDRNRK